MISLGVGTGIGMGGFVPAAASLTPAPTAVHASAPDSPYPNTTLAVHWTVPAGVDPNANIQFRARAVGDTDWHETLSTTAASTQPFIYGIGLISAIAGGTALELQARIDASSDGSGPFSTWVNATALSLGDLTTLLDAPTGLAINDGAEGFSVSTDALPGAENGYAIYLDGVLSDTGDSLPYSVVADPGVYAVTVAGVDSFDRAGIQCSPVNGTSRPEAPTGLSVTPTFTEDGGQGSADYAWTSGSDQTTFRIAYRQDSGGTWLDWVESASVAGTERATSAVAPIIAQTQLRVRAEANGVYSDASNIVTIDACPTISDAEPAGSGEIAVTSNAAGAIIWKTKASGGDWTVNSLTDANGVLAGLVPDSPYGAIVQGNNTWFSNPVSASTGV